MTDYIEKMMRTAGVIKECVCHFKTEDNNTIVCGKKRDLISLIKDYKIKGRVVRTTMTPHTYFPDFTAEKQLEIIKLIGKQKNILEDESGVAFTFCSNMCQIKYQPFTSYYNDDISCTKQVQHQDFTQALAQLTTELMKSNELDKEKVKGILEK